MDFNPDLGWKALDDQGFNTHIGPILFRRDDNGWYGAIELTDSHINAGGVCHGGVYLSLADTTMGIGASFVMDRRRAATISLEQHFVAAAKLGQVLVCRARLSRAVSGLAFMHAEAWAGGRQCTRASGVWKALAGQHRALP